MSPSQFDTVKCKPVFVVAGSDSAVVPRGGRGISPGTVTVHGDNSRLL